MFTPIASPMENEGTILTCLETSQASGPALYSVQVGTALSLHGARASLCPCSGIGASSDLCLLYCRCRSEFPPAAQIEATQDGDRSLDAHPNRHIQGPPLSQTALPLPHSFLPPSFPRTAPASAELCWCMSGAPVPQDQS